MARTRAATFETGCVRAFCGEIVYEHDKFDRQYAPKRNLFHAPAGGDRREEIGAYALVEFKDGTIDWEYADKKLIERHRRHSKQPESPMWTKFHEEGWKKTAIRILAKRLPLGNLGMEGLVEVIERDARTEMEPEPAGRLELDPESPFSRPSTPPLVNKPRETESRSNPQGIAEVFFEVGKETTTITGRSIPLKDVFPKLGGKWDRDARDWRIPAARTHELMAACEESQIRAEERFSHEPGELF